METGVLNKASELFDVKEDKPATEEIDSEKLYAQISQLKVENDFCLALK